MEAFLGENMVLNIVLILFFVLLHSCGDYSPYAKKYQGATNPTLTQEASSDQNYSVVIAPLYPELEGIGGEVAININQTDVTSKIILRDIPQSLMIGQRSISTLSCDAIAISYTLPVIENPTMEFKNIDETDYASKESFIAELNQINPMNGEAIDLAGKSYVIKAYAEEFSPTAPINNVLIPIACGIIE